MKHFLLFISILFVSTGIYAQGSVEGKLVDSETKSPIGGVVVKLVAPSFERTYTTTKEGAFIFENLFTGIYTIVVSESGYFESSIDVDYVAGETKVIEDINIERAQLANDMNREIPVMDLAEDDGGSAVASLLNSSRDIFVINAIFGLGQGGFRNRGYFYQDQSLFINGIPLENITQGNSVTYNDYAGLNDVMRSRNNFYGIKPISFTFGEQTNNVEIDVEALRQREGLRVTQWFSNRTYRHRTTATYNTGLLKNNFAFSGSLGYRGAKEGYLPGTPMQTISAFFSASKLWSQKLNTSLSVFYVDNIRSVASSSTDEFYQLAGTNYYNPNWGYQNGEIRSANTRRDNAPIIILSSDFKPSSKTHIKGSIGYQFGQRYRERLDWYNSYNPRPNYYRNAPSFYKDNPYEYNEVYNNIITNPDLLQINWERLYTANKTNTEVLAGQNPNDRWSRYNMNKEKNDIQNISANVIAKHHLNNMIDLSGGLMFQSNRTESYRELSDLLGGDYFVNINQFAQRANPDNPNAIHNDLNNPNGIVKVGDRYGYNYISNVMNVTSWGQSVITLKKVDAFAALRMEYTSYAREGLYKNGAFPGNSFGKAPNQSFLNLDIKGGVTYKIDGKNYVSLGLARWTNAPQYEQVFVLPRTTNIINNNLNSMNITTGELSYYRRGSRVKGNITGFYTLSQDETEVRRFYTELTNSFGSLLLNGVNKRYVGIEAAVEAQIANTGLTGIAIANIADYIYDNRPSSVFYYDNSDQATDPETVYFKDLHLATGPQLAGSLKLMYRSKDYWMLVVSANYFDKNYVDASPQRRTTDAVLNIPVGSDLYNKILTQEKMPSAITFDMYFRKSFLINKYIKSLKNRMFFDVSVNVTNILDVQDYRRLGREQLRFDFRDRDPDKFPNTFSYMLGRSFFVNFVFRM